MYRTAFATTLFTALAVAVCSGSARGAFPGADGMIAFVNDRNGSPSIFTMDADASNVERLISNNPQGEFAVSSPDGKKILFSVRLGTEPKYNYELWTMNGDGSHIGRFLAESSDRPIASTWSPDGKRIAFYRNGSLWLVNANRKHAREITKAEFSDSAPSWSRRGLIAFDRGGSVRVVNPKSGEERLIASGSQPTWSPDGGRLAFVAVPRGAAERDVFVTRADGSGRTRLAATPGADETQPAWSPNGRWIAFTSKGGVYSIRSDGTDSRLVVAKGQQPSWTRGSNGVVYTRRTPRWNGFVLRTNLNGKHTRWLLRPRVDASPAWSPDGTRLAFTRDGVVHLIEPGEAAPRSIGLRGADPAWSPDGERIVVASGLDLIVANSDGSEQTPLDLKLDPAKYTRLSEPEWSAVAPDNLSSIAFVATNTDGIRSVFVLRLQTKTLKLSPKSPDELGLGCETVGADSPSWSPTTNEIAFACDQSIAISKSDGSNLVPLGSADNATLAWAPSGSQIVFSSQFGDQQAQLNTMNSDGTVPVELNTGSGSSDQPDWQPLP